MRAAAAKCDVLIENYKVGTLARYGLALPTLEQDQPATLIYCSITGFGQSGPYAARPGYDFVFQGMGGTDEHHRRARQTCPAAARRKVGIAITDNLTGMYASLAMTAAIAHRERTGESQHIDMALPTRPWP